MAELGMTYEEVKTTSDTIKDLTNKVKDSAENLKEVAEECVKRGIQIDWAEDLLRNLNTYYENDMQDGFNEMLLQADKLLEASEAVSAYEQEQ